MGLWGSLKEKALRIADPRDMKHNVEIILYDRDGSEISRTKKHNVVTTVGKAALANLALGTDNTAASAGQTALVAETSATGMARKTCDSLSISTSTMVLDATWTNGSGGTVTVQECGVFNTSGTPKMLARSLTNSHAVGDGQSIRIVYNIPIA